MSRFANRMKPMLGAALFACACLCFGDSIELSNGKILKGDLSGRKAQYVSITRKENQSEIEIRVESDDILRIEFSDAFTKQEAIDSFHSADLYQAISLLEPLISRRIPYIDLLSEEDERLFVILLESYRKSGRGSDCLEHAKLWQTKLQAPQTLSDIQELQIVASWEMQRPEEAAYYAQRWIDSGQSARESSIAWNVLAENALESGQANLALWIALNPIVFSQVNPARYLAQSYEVAIVAAHRLRHDAYAKELLDEMRARKLPWTIDSPRVATLEKLDSIESNNEKISPFHSTSNSQQARSANTLSKLVGRP